MKLEKKRNLASRALKVGKNRIVFNTSRLKEIKEAITKQDIKDLKESGAIAVKEVKGRRKIVKRKTRRRFGSIKKKVKGGKRKYVILTRKLRAHLKYLKRNKKITQEEFIQLRKKIKNSAFRSLAHLNEYIKETKK